MHAKHQLELFQIMEGSNFKNIYTSIFTISISSISHPFIHPHLQPSVRATVGAEIILSKEPVPVTCRRWFAEPRLTEVAGAEVGREMVVAVRPVWVCVCVCV